MAERFLNTDGSQNTKGLTDLLRWQLRMHDEVRPKTPRTGVTVPTIQNDGQELQRAVLDALTWVGHATYLIQLGGVSALIDPVMGALTPIPRNVAPGLSWAALPKVDVVFITHNHRDHMDAPTLKRLGKDAVYVVPRGLGQWFLRRGFRRTIEMAWWEEREVCGLHVTFVPSQHWSRRGLNDMNTSLWGGYVIERGGIRVYHSGDTAAFDGFSDIGERCGPIEAAMLPIGAYAPRWFMKAQHMNPDDAVDAFMALGAQRFVAMHWGTFKLTDEPLDEPPHLLRARWAADGLSNDVLNVPAIGQTLRLD